MAVRRQGSWREEETFWGRLGTLGDVVKDVSLNGPQPSSSVAGVETGEWPGRRESR